MSAVFDLQEKGVAVVGPVPAGLPSLAIPAVTIQDIFALLPAAFALTILIYADEVLTARVFAAKHGSMGTGYQLPCFATFSSAWWVTGSHSSMLSLEEYLRSRYPVPLLL